MHNASYRRETVKPGLDKAVHLGLVRNVAPADNDIGAQCSKLVNQFFHLACHRAASGYQNDVSGSLPNHPLGHALS